MDAVQTGKFISELRKQKGFTQKELAEKLVVTDKAVSRWETGKGFPDTSLLKPLSELLEVSVGELLAGERIQEEHFREQTDRVILDSLNYSKKMLVGMVNLVLILLGVCFMAAPLFVTGVGLGYVVLGAVLIAAAVIRIIWKRTGRTIRLANRTVYLLAAICQALALCLELLPFSSATIYAAGPDQTFVQTYSYFNLIPYGGGNFSPMLTGLMTVVILILTVISLIFYKKAVKIRNAAFICSIIAAVLSLMPLAFLGSRWMTPASYAVSGGMILSICLQAVANRNAQRPAVS